MDQSEVKHLPKVDHTPAELDEVSKRLLKAAARIEKLGHWDGGRTRFGGTCVLLAIKDAGEVMWDDIYEMAMDRFAKAVGIHSKWEVCEKLYAWNDERTADEVIAKLRAVALGL